MVNNKGIVCGYSHILISLLMVVSNSLGEGNVPVEMVCLQENVVLQWDILKYSKMDYAYIRHGLELIVTIGSLTDILIEDEFKSQVQFTITEPLQIEMTIFNVTKATNGTYTCTIGAQGKQEHIIKKEISVIDPDITLSLDTDNNDCKTLNCFSAYKVDLLGPNKRKPKRDTCLLKEDDGIYSCCLVNKSMCRSTYCKYIDVRLDGHYSINQSRITETTTLFTALSYNLNQQNLDSIVFPVMSLIIFGLVATIMIVLYVRTKRTSNSFEQTSYTEYKTQFTRFILIRQNIYCAVFSVMAIINLVLLTTVIVLIAHTKFATCEKSWNVIGDNRNQQTPFTVYVLVSCTVLFLLTANIGCVLRRNYTEYKRRRNNCFRKTAHQKEKKDWITQQQNEMTVL